jgi:hypothetical protein
MSCAAATVAAVFAWGGSNASVVTLQAAEPPAVAEVVFVNTLTFGSPREPFTLRSGGVEVSVSIEFGPGSEPEVMTVETPEGLIAVPAVLVVDDYTTGTVRIFCADGVGM